MVAEDIAAFNNRYEIIKNVSFTSSQLTSVIALPESKTGKGALFSSCRIIKNMNRLIISPHQTTESANILIEETDKKVIFSNGN